MLTRDDVMALSGDALNEAVAERVYGWTRLEGDAVPLEHRCGSADGPQLVWVDKCGNRLACKWCGDMPDWQGDWSAMGALIEHMTAQGWNLYIEGGYENEFMCGFQQSRRDAKDERCVWFDVKGHTAAQAVSEIPGAVSKAALLAVGEANPDA